MGFLRWGAGPPARQLGSAFFQPRHGSAASRYLLRTLGSGWLESGEQGAAIQLQLKVAGF
jgi:hypothetical protein